MKAKEMKTSEVLGCMNASLAFLVNFPIRAAITFWLLQQASAPTWLWVAFWVMVPASILSSGLAWLTGVAHRGGD